MQEEKEKEILVSITSLAYNHERYVRRALDSFVSQKTDFAFEILIHDDASTDGTAAIIREYEEKYPELMRPVYQTENQHSKGVKVGVELHRRARGKYIAFCEADDYWTDPLKLQKQVDYLEAHPECSLCVHAAGTVDADGNPLPRMFRASEHDCDFDATDVILSGGGMFQTNTMLARREFMTSYPDFYYHSTVGDYPFQIYMGMCGKIHYLNEVLSVYRVQAVGSWSASVLTSTEKTVKHCENMCRLLEEIAVYDGGKYRQACEQRILLFHLYTALLTGDSKTVKALRSGADRRYLTRNMKIGVRFPRLYCYLRHRRIKKQAAAAANRR